MRILGSIFVLLVLVCNQAFAISLINRDEIKAAQYYGEKHAHMEWEEFLLPWISYEEKTPRLNEFSEFLLPWISYEEKTPRLNEFSEKAYLYTKFLLIATDAREKRLKGVSPQLEDSEDILTNYNGYLTFSVTLYGSQEKFGQNAVVTLKQGDASIKAYQVVIPPIAERMAKSTEKPTYRLQCYVYFLEKNIVYDKPVILSISTKDKRKHNFYFDFAQVK
ncbi:MAG: hypothetical protein H6Q69_1165 [Firmicutes bacterium]|nr:hypothetical protein [Bacillota bacterium]